MFALASFTFALPAWNCRALFALQLEMAVLFGSQTLSCIPRSVGQSPIITKNPILPILSICLHFDVNTPNCSMPD